MLETEGIYPKYVVFKHPDFVPDLIEAVAYPPYKGGFTWRQMCIPGS